jgi:thioredoxin-dependent peroxiredoxin
MTMTKLTRSRSLKIRAAIFALSAATLVAGCAAATTADPPAGKDAGTGPKVGDEAKDFELDALGGGKVKLSKLVAGGPVVLVVLRGYPGYQCPLCTRQFGEFLGKADEFNKAGARVVFVYPGPSDRLQERAGEFVKGKDYPDHFQILLDPDYSFTTAYGLRWDARNETAYPSTFVVDGKRKVTFAKVSKTHGDRARAEDALKAIPGR